MSAVEKTILQHKGGKNKKRYKSVKRDMKERVLYRDNYICHYCGYFGDTVDHLIPQSKGGINDESNLVCSCEDCNQKKANVIPDDIRNKIFPKHEGGSFSIADILMNKRRVGNGS